MFLDIHEMDLISLVSRPTKTDATGISCIVPFASHVDQTGTVFVLCFFFYE